MSRLSTPLVTVLTPVYNGAEFLAECIESVLTQTYKNFEYIIVDNRSTDGTSEIAARYAAMDGRIRVYRNERFVDVIANHNIAFNLMASEAAYCKVVSADDYIFPECLDRMVEFGQTNPTVGIIGAYQVSGSVVKWQGFQYPRTVFSGIELGRHVLAEPQIFVKGEPIFGFGTPTSLMYRADLVRETDAFYPNASPHADTSACFSSLRKSDFGFIYQVLSGERTHTATQSAKSARMNRYSPSYLRDLLHYGSAYLAKEDLDRKVGQTLRTYHRFLAKSYLFGRGDKEFWEYHRQQLQELGYPLSRFALLKSVIPGSLQEAKNMLRASRLVSGRDAPVRVR